MMEKYRIYRIADGVSVPHIEGKICDCGRILPLSHKGPCPNCNSTVLREAVIPNLSDLREAEVDRSRKTNRFENEIGQLMGGTN